MKSKMYEKAFYAVSFWFLIYSLFKGIQYVCKTN